MNEKDTGGPAYPVKDEIYIGGGEHDTRVYTGMTLRDYFAIHADLADVSYYRCKNSRSGEYALSITEARYSFADAMIKERNK